MYLVPRFNINIHIIHIIERSYGTQRELPKKDGSFPMAEAANRAQAAEKVSFTFNIYIKYEKQPWKQL